MKADEVEALARHLESCPHCCRAFEREGLPSDWPGALGTPATPAPLAIDDNLRALMERLEGLARSGPTLGADEREELLRAYRGVMSPPRADGEIGVLGSYRVLELLGAGGMGAVFRAEETVLGRSVALKLMKPELALSSDARQRFLREGRAAARVHHDHVVTIYQAGEQDGVAFLAMEYLHGESLEDRLKRVGRLTPAATVRIGREIAEGLQAAHAAGLIHRDIKPSNLWLERRRDRVKILDFGLAWAAEPVGRLTHSRAVLGTPEFIAPEQADGAVVDARSDLFGVGCVLYLCCTGELPFKGSTALQTLKAIALEDPRPPHEVCEDVPRQLSDLIVELVAKDPSRRPASAARLAERLTSLAKDQDKGPIYTCPHCAAPMRLPPTPHSAFRCPSCRSILRPDSALAQPSLGAPLSPPAVETAALPVDEKSDDEPQPGSWLRSVLVAAFSAVCVVVGGGLVWSVLLLGLLPHRQDDAHADAKKGDVEPFVDVRPFQAATARSGALTRELLEQAKAATVFLQVGLPDGSPGTGSGFFIEKSLILTNAHVVGMLDGEQKEPEVIQATLWSGEAGEETLKARVLAVDRDSDLALLKVDAGSTALPVPLMLAGADALHETQPVYILGFPYGEALGKQVTVSASSISSLRKRSGLLTEIQVNGGMHPGNSGGPIIASDGKVVGVAVAGIRGTQINFGIPVHKALAFVNGRVGRMTTGVPFIRDGKTLLPLTAELLDPVERIEKLEVEAWPGSPERPPELPPQSAAAGDGPRQTTPLTIEDHTTAQGELLLHASPQEPYVLWLAPVATDKSGQRHVLRAVSFKVPPTVIPGPALLVRKFTPGQEVIALKIKSTLRTYTDGVAGPSLERSSQTEIVELMRAAEKKQYRFQLKHATITARAGHKETPGDRELDQVLEQAFRSGLDAQVDDAGAFVSMEPDVSIVPHRRDVMKQYLDHIALALEMATPTLPGTKVEPGTTWRATRLAVAGPLQTPPETRFDLSYTYRGLQAHGARRTAVGIGVIAGQQAPPPLRRYPEPQAAMIEISGKARSHLRLDDAVFGDGKFWEGTARGHALVEIGTGELLSFEGVIEINRSREHPDGPVRELRQTIEIDLRRGLATEPPVLR